MKTSKARTKIRNFLNIEHEHNPKTARAKTEDKNYIKQIKIKEKISNVKLSKCCNPKPFDKIVAYYTKDKKVTIHKKDCSNIHSLEDTKNIPVSWKEKEEPKMSFRIVVKDRVGMLSDILNIFSNEDINIHSIHTKNKKGNSILHINIKKTENINPKKLFEEIDKVVGVLDILK